ncbi:endospore germination permease [Paenibacillus sp. LjRoot153]|uniref:GerAB/ArcD/ProY family transporter n=1 Tax=Paenibacillus sp. LjRoot153 TaxID=3342270 RepID=UPI003ECFD710
MDLKEYKISARQLGVLFFTYLTGSSIINIPGPLIAVAKNNAWLSILISWTAGCLLLTGMLYLHKRFPSTDFIDISSSLIGKAATFIIVILLPLPFIIHIGTGITLDVGLFMESTMMSETPIYIFTSTILIVTVLTVLSGIEVIAQMFALLLVTLLVFVGIVLVLSIPDYDFSNLKPLLPSKFKPVILGAYMSFSFPYAELFLFSMLIPFVREDERHRIPKVMFVSMSLNLIVLILVTMSTILVFGPIAGDRKFPMFELARMIEVQEIIQRIESVIGMSLIVGSFMKVTIALYVMNLFIVRLFNLRDSRLVILIVGMIFFLNGKASFTGVRKWGEIVSYLGPMWEPFAFVMPLAILLAVSVFRRNLVQARPPN